MKNKNDIAVDGNIDNNSTVSQYYSCFDQTLVETVRHIYISSEISSPVHYQGMINMIQTAPPNSTIVLHLNSPGGDLDTCVQIISAMQITMANVVCSIEGIAASAAGFIFLAGDSFVVSDFGVLMLHNYSSLMYGKGHEQRAYLDAMDKQTRALFDKILYPFLSNAEINRMKSGEDFYFQASDIRKRIDAVLKADAIKSKSGNIQSKKR